MKYMRDETFKFMISACDGGFPYLVEKYAEDYGLVLESCNPYIKPFDGKCTTGQTCHRYYNTNYGYIGGFYGA